MQFEEQLDNIKFYQTHPTLKPFVGKNYADNESGAKILLVAESHYIKNVSPEITKENLLNDWWSDAPPQLYDTDDQSWYTTRDTINNFMNGKSRKSYATFREPCNVFNQCFCNGIYQQKTDIYKLFDAFAFMNYFQMPALYKGESLWRSLLRFSEWDKKKALEIWNKTEEMSNKVFLEVLEVLKPDKIVFVSKEAYNAFLRQNKDYDANKVFVTVHPTCRWWNTKMKADNLTGKERLVNFFNKIAKERK